MREMDDGRDHLPWPAQLRLALLGPFGQRYVGGRRLAILYTAKGFHSLKGPRAFFFVIPGRHIRSIISIAPQHLSTRLSDILSKDGLSFQVDIDVQFAFDPRRLPRERVMAAVHRYNHEGGAAQIVQSNAQHVLQGVLHHHPGEQIARNEVTPIIQERFLAGLASRLEPYALYLVAHDSFVRALIPPESLRVALQRAAERNVSIANLDQFTEEELERQLRMKRAEALESMQGGIISMNADQERAAPRLGTPADPRIITSTARQIEPKQPLGDNTQTTSISPAEEDAGNYPSRL